MISPIIENVSSDKRLTLRMHDRFVRKPKYMQTAWWSRIRIGFRVSIVDRSTDLINGYLNVGICSGNTGISGDGTVNAGSSVVHFFGIQLQANFGQWVRQTVPTRYNLTWSTVVRIVNGVTTQSGDVEPNQYLFCSDTSRTCIIVDIRKGSPNFSCQYMRNTSTAATDVSKATFDAQMLLSTPVITNHAFTTDTAVACSESAGIFDHINIAYSCPTPLRISDLRVVYFWG